MKRTAPAGQCGFPWDDLVAAKGCPERRRTRSSSIGPHTCVLRTHRTGEHVCTCSATGARLPTKAQLPISLTSTEAQWSTQVKNIAEAGGFTLRYHTHNSMHSPAGFPDWTFLNPDAGVLIFAELKTEWNNATELQWEWLLALRSTGHDAFLWRPSDLPDVKEVLLRARFGGRAVIS
jgi:hypothetical protein